MGLLLGFASGLLLSGLEPSLLRSGESGLFFGLTLRLLFCSLESRAFLSCPSGLFLGCLALGLLFGRLVSGPFLSHAPGLGLCCTVGSELRFLGVDRVALGEGFPLLGQSFLWARGTSISGLSEHVFDGRRKAELREARDSSPFR